MNFRTFFNLVNSTVALLALLVSLADVLCGFNTPQWLNNVKVVVFTIVISNLFFFTWHILRLRSLKKINIFGFKNVQWSKYVRSISALPYKEALKLLFRDIEEVKKENDKFMAKGSFSGDLEKEANIADEFMQSHIEHHIVRLLDIYMKELDIPLEEARGLFFWFCLENRNSIINEYVEYDADQQNVYVYYDTLTKNIGKQIKKGENYSFNEFDFIVKKYGNLSIVKNNLTVRNVSIGYIDFIFKQAIRMRILNQGCRMLFQPFNQTSLFEHFTRGLKREN